MRVGQALFFVPSEKWRGGPSTVVVQSVGRKWAKLSNGERVNVQTGWAEGGDVGRAYASRSRYEARVARQALWDHFHARFRHTYHVPEGVTAAAIAKAMALLGLSDG